MLLYRLPMESEGLNGQPGGKRIAFALEFLPNLSYNGFEKREYQADGRDLR